MKSKLQGKLKRLHGSRVRALEHGDQGRPEGVFEAGSSDQPASRDSARSALARVVRTWDDLGFLGHPPRRIEAVDDSLQHGRYLMGALLRRAQTYSAQPLLLPPLDQTVGYLDIETDGLHDGCVSFCVGVARWEPDGLEFTQFGLEDVDDEPLMLKAVADWCASVDCLVTFNGRAFDLPRLRTRWAFHGIKDPTKARGHVDLLQVARRLIPGSRTLTELERSLLGFVRQHDVPGSEAPKRWETYQIDHDLRGLSPVLDHNRLDVLTLVVLAHHLYAMTAEVGVPVVKTSNEPGSITKRLRHTYRLKKTREVSRRAVPVSKPSAPRAPGDRLAKTRAEVEVLIANQTWERAIPLLYEMIMLAPTHPYPVRVLAGYYDSMGDQELALRFQRRLSDLEPF